MKINFLYIPALVFSLSFLISCNSTGYEIEEVEDYSDTTVVTSRNEIKQEVEQPKVEIKTDVAVNNETVNNPVKKEPVLFTVQLGAFGQEENAAALTEKLDGLFNVKVSYKLVNGMYKVRAGEFASKEDAILLLQRVTASGYEGFITEASK